jgi:hypothetical protein
MEAKPSPWQPVVDKVSIFVFLCLSVKLLALLIKSFNAQNRVAIVVAFLLSSVLADFISGFVHWAADTWGTAQWPIVGPALIGPFREHHIDKKGITRHDFAETNGNNCLVSIPVLVALFFIPHLENPMGSFFFALFLGLTSWIFMTNQFHKWSHEDNVPWVIDVLQKSRLILPRDHHDLHHQYPFTKNYCITTGWMNPILNKFRFFPILESLITKLTGAQPRQEDLSLTEPKSLAN